MKCDNCGVRVKFLDGLRQPTPFHFRCTQCGVKYRVRTPYMVSIVVGIIIYSALVTGAVVAAVIIVGPHTLLASIPFFVGSWLGLEVWIHEYISRNGEFERL